jgi:hypothetical protein
MEQYTEQKEATSAQACDRQPKNVALSEAIESLDRTYEMANDLLLRIIGNPNPVPVEKVAESTTPCLRDVLSAGPDNIREKGLMIEGILREIEEALF